MDIFFNFFFFIFYFLQPLDPPIQEVVGHLYDVLVNQCLGHHNGLISISNFHENWNIFKRELAAQSVLVFSKIYVNVNRNSQKDIIHALRSHNQSIPTRSHSISSNSAETIEDNSKCRDFLGAMLNIGMCEDRHSNREKINTLLRLNCNILADHLTNF